MWKWFSRKKCLVVGVAMTVITVKLIQLMLYDDEKLYIPELDPPLTSGRSESDGKWFSQTVPYRFYLYSAFFDNRTTLGSYYNHLRVIVVMETLPAGHYLSCEIYHPRTKVITARLSSIGAGVEHGTRFYEEFVLTCDLPRRYPRPLSVTIVDNKGHLNISRVPVELAQQPDEQQELAVCVSVSYWNLNPYFLVEWFEMQKILGVSTVFIYNNSIRGEANRVLSLYRDEGFVVIRQSFSFIRDPEERLIHLHMSPVINDCMYRNMFAYSHLAVIDVDEVIVPRKYKMTLPDLISVLPKLVDYDLIGSYVFQNAYFFFDLRKLSQKNQKDNSEATPYLLQTRRLPASPPGYSAKSIINTQACVAMHNHYCLEFTPEVLSVWNPVVDVEPKIALLHHYKWCHFDEYLQSPGYCADLLKKSVFDNVVRKYYSALLSKNLKAQYKKLQLS